MKLFILLVLCNYGYCSKYDLTYPVSYESKLSQYENHYDDYKKDSKSYSDSKEYDGYERNRGQEHLEMSEDEDFKKIDEKYDKYIENHNRYNNYRRRQKRSNDEETNEKLDKIFGYTGPTANDEPENLMRPCALNDWQCIRKYFAANGKCKPAYGPIPDPLILDMSTVYFSVANMTLVLPNLQVRGLSSAKMRDFYVNKKTGNVVFVIDVQNFNQTVPRGYFRYQRTAKESIVLADYATISYRNLTLTAIIPKVPDLRLDLADAHVDVKESVPPFFVGPGAANSTDPDVVTGYAEFLTGLPIAIRESLFFESQLFAAIYIQTNICDFGLNLISV